KKIDASMIMSLSDSELIRLGVDTIGDRHLLRETINQKLKHTFASELTETGTSNNITSSRSRMAQEIAHERATLFSGQIRGRKRPRSSSHSGRQKSQSRGWTVQFVCLANKESRYIPTATEKEILHKAGFGVKKIRLDADDEEEDVVQKLMSGELYEENKTLGFPQLNNCGGIELLRTSQNCRTLKLIDC
ncbi:hypothetical protein CHS0354_017241, partial [Potamilus streckersoni]